MPAEIDPITGLPRKINLPYGTAGQPLPLVSQFPAANVTPVTGPTAPQQQDLSNQVIQTTQQKVLQGTQTPTLDLTSQKTQELLKAPVVGAAPEVAGGQAAEKYGFEASQGLEALR